MTAHRPTDRRPRSRIWLPLRRVVVLAVLFPGIAVVSTIAAAPAHATGLQTTVMSPIAGQVTSSPQEPHHRPYGGDYSFDVAVGGGDVHANFRNTNGSLSLTVAQIGRACGSGSFADGGDKVVLNVIINGAKVGTVTYAHLTNFSYTSGNVPVGARLGRIATTADGLRKSDANKCWTGPHVHVEPRNDFRFGCFIGGLQNASINTGQPLGIVGGERAGAANAACGANPETVPANDEPRGSFDDVFSPGPGLATIRGWAFDPNDVGPALEIHAYTGGPAGTPGVAGHNLGFANAPRADVGAAFPGVGDNHGFDVTFETRPGAFTMYVYAINRPGTPGGNVLLGTRDVTVENPNPFGSFDQATSPQPGEVAIGGWILDPNDRAARLGVHVYVGAPAGDPNAEFHDIGPAGGFRPDVDDVFPGSGDNHGYEASFSTAKSGDVPVFVYAIDVGPGDNQLIGSKTVAVTAGVPRIAAVAAPRITGTPKVGNRLTASLGRWSEPDATYTFQWRRNGSAIRGATGRTYKLARVDRNRRISVRVTARKLGYASGGQNSAATRRVN